MKVLNLQHLRNSVRIIVFKELLKMGKIEKKNVRDFFRVPDLALSDLRTYEELCEQFCSSFSWFCREEKVKYRGIRYVSMAKTGGQNYASGTIALNDHTFWHFGDRKFHYYSGHVFKVTFDPRTRRVTDKPFHVQVLAVSVRQRVIHSCDFDTYEEMADWLLTAFRQLGMMKKNDYSLSDYESAFSWFLGEYGDRFAYDGVVFMAERKAGRTIHVDFGQGSGSFDVTYNQVEHTFTARYSRGDESYRGKHPTLAATFFALLARHYGMSNFEYMERYQIAKEQ